MVWSNRALSEGCGSRVGVVDTTLRSALGRFPDRRGEILARMQECQSFRELCLDYGKAVEALDRLEADPSSSDRDRATYVELVGELELEIVETLSRSRGRPARDLR